MSPHRVSDMTGDGFVDAQGGADMMTGTNITTQKLADWPTRRLLRRLQAVGQFAVDYVWYDFHYC